VACPENGRSEPAFKLALREINRFAALGAFVVLVEFVGKNLLLLATVGAVADKGFKILELLESGAVLRRVAHGITLLAVLADFGKGNALWFINL
jgi:hypothetical protein